MSDYEREIHGGFDDGCGECGRLNCTYPHAVNDYWRDSPPPPWGDPRRHLRARTSLGKGLFR